MDIEQEILSIKARMAQYEAHMEPVLGKLPKPTTPTTVTEHVEPIEEVPVRP